MARYLQRYVGTYRVLAEYDKATNDFPRIPEGCNKGMLDPSFDDLFITCRAKGRIYHVGGNNLQYYCPSLIRGHNIVKSIYIDTISQIKEPFDYESLYNDLTRNGLIYDIEDTDSEVLFKFKAKNIDIIAEYVEPRTSGVGINPFSRKNLRKEKYYIPSEELALYKEITAVIPKEGMRVYIDMNKAFLDNIKGKSIRIMI